MEQLYSVSASFLSLCKKPILTLAALVVLASSGFSQRVTANLISLYEFNEGSGNTVNDVSGVAPAMNLTIQTPANTAWISGGGLDFNSGTIAKTAGAATKLYNALNASGEFTMEAWIQPNSTSQNGPARIMTMSSNTTERNFMLAQDNGNYVARLRTTSGGDNNGLPNQTVAGLATNYQHVVYTWKNGTQKLYVNGVLKNTSTKGGNLSNWNNAYAFAIGNELTNDRAWLGNVFLVALYCQELDLNEVLQNYEEGFGDEPYVQETCVMTGYESLTGRIFYIPAYGTDFKPSTGGLNILKYSNGTAHITGVIERISNNTKKFAVSIWLNNKSTFSQWIAQGRAPHSPNLGDETTWTYYDFDPSKNSTLIGQSGLAGTTLYLTNQDPNYGIQLGNGANALNTNNNGISSWFNYTGTTSGNGDINGTYDCSVTCDASISNLRIYNLTSSNEFDIIQNGETYTLASLPASWNIEALTAGTTVGSVRFTITGSVSDTHTENSTPYRYPGDTNPITWTSGTYTIKAELFNADDCGGEECDEIIRTITIIGCDNTTNGGSIGVDQNGCAPYDAAVLTSITPATGGSGTLEYIWKGKNASTGWNWITIPGATGATYDPGNITETTKFKRYARRANCANWDVYSNEVTITVTENCEPETECLITGYESLTGRIFWIPLYGTDFKASAGNGGLHFEQYSNGTAHMFGVLERISNSTHKFAVNLWFYNRSTFAQWIAQGRAPHSPNLGDETTWIFYDFDPNQANTLIGQGALAGVTLYLSNQDPNYGLQLGNGANAQNTNANGISAWFHYTGTQTDHGDINGSYDCSPVCDLEVDAHSNDLNICPGEQITIGTTVTGASVCEEEGITDCNHTVANSGGWLENTSASAVCGDNAGTKLWTQSGDGTSYITIDLGSQVPSGTQICVNMKLEHCSNSGTNYSNAKIQASTLSNSGFVNLTSSVTFSQTSYQEFCYTLSSAARYIKVLDNGNCAFRVDYVEYTTTGEDDNTVTYLWTGPGIVGSTTGATITVNEDGTYTVTVTDCNGCEATDQVIITSGDCCDLEVDAHGNDLSLCYPEQVVITSTITGASNCQYEGVTDCNHTVANSGNWLENISASAVCGDNAGTKLWTQSGQGTSYITIDLGTEVPTGTQICVNMKLEHCSNSGTSYSNAKIQASTLANSGFVNLTSSVTFSQTSYQEFCYTLSSPARYIKVLDNGNCAFRVDYVEYTTPGGNNNALTYLWTGPGIVGANNGVSITVNQAGTYTVTVTDCAGCTDSDQVVVTVDDIDPVFDSQQNTYNLVCGQSIPLIQPTATDNNGAVTYSYVDVVTCTAPNAYCECTHTRVWTAYDLCLNAATFTQYFIYSDDTAPVLVGVPANATVQCNAVPTAAIVTATDNCDVNVLVVFTQEIGTGCPYTIVRTWVATDDCGNTSSAYQTLTVVDTQAPVLINVPANATAECSNIPVAPVVTATDNCDNSLEIGYNEAFVPGNSCTYQLIRTWQVIDDCGNMASASQTLTVTDTTAPIIIDAPANDTIQCNSIPSAAIVHATDNCDQNVEIGYNQVMTGDCPYILTRTWTATDNCGNVAIAVQTLYVIDETAPVLHGVPANTTIECDEPVSDAVVFAIDNCDDSLEVSMSANTYPQVCGYLFVRTWTVTDNCGNEATASQTITVVDYTNPYVVTGVPAELTIECNTTEPLYTPVFADNCDDSLAVVLISGIGNVTPCGYDIQRAWTATDDCGNAVTVYQVIHVVDTTAPVFTEIPANVTVQCDAIPTPAILTATDNCHEVSIDFSQVVGGGCPYTITRTWIANDGCGNTTTAIQVIYVIDTINPVLVGVPEDISVECTNIPEPAYVYAYDNCDDTLYVDMDEEIIQGSGCTYLVVRTWSTTDDCGNSVSDEQVIVVIDTTNPILVGVPASVTVECDNVPAAPAVYATDACDDEVELEYTETSTTGCPYTITRTWTATDRCNNDTTAVQVITVVDTTNPILWNVPANDTLLCTEEAAPVMVWATDNCSDSLEVSLDANTIDLECGHLFVRIWSVTDDCGNTTSATQTITFIDTIAPYIINAPVDITVECSDTIPAYVPMWGDNCDLELELAAISSTGFDDCYTWIHTTYFATDDCGNMSSVVRNINIVDTTDPILAGVPANVTVECTNIPGPATSVTASDNCDEQVDITYTADTVAVGCNYVITRTWTATDECNNWVSQSQAITVIDTTAPILIGVPANVTVECSAIPTPAVVLASDNCWTGVLEVIYSSDIVPVDSCSYLIIRTWTVADNCENTVSGSQTITVIDTTAPILIGVPGNLTVECDEIPAPAEVTATDNCDPNVDVVYTTATSEGCPYTITRTWTAADDCGNTTTATQVINVMDITNPILWNVPANDTLECTMEAPAVIVWATDNCSDSLEVSLDANTIDLECGHLFVRIWSVTDDCGNTTSATQTITFTDTTAPYIINAPVDINVECSDTIPAYVPMWGDNCDLELELTAASSIGFDDCYTWIHQTYTATDDCGNQTTVVRNINIVDTTDPILAGVPANVTVECTNIPGPATSVTASDNCDEQVDITYTADTVAVGCNYVITRTWTATDECNNWVSQSQVITVIDTTAPILIGVPANVTVECSAIPTPAVVLASDNCWTGVLEVIYSSDIVPVDSCSYLIIRTWTVADNCENTVSGSQTITVIDTTAPILIGVPGNLTVECDEIPAPAEVTATDNCDPNVDVVYTTATSEGCPYTITRTWTAADDCGNTTTATQVINVIDITNPILWNVPANDTLECTMEAPAVIVWATDNCSDSLEVSLDANTIDLECGHLFVRIWSVTDDCGNTTTATQTITFTDTTAPYIINAPVDINVECSDTIPAYVPMWGDNCDMELELAAASSIGFDDCYTWIHQTYTATDDCGNQTTVVRNINIVDTTAPVLNGLPENVTAECDNVPAPVTSVWASDNCDEQVEVVFTADTVIAECGYIIYRTWVATDECDNTASHTQVVTVTDTTAPYITNNPPIVYNIECGEELPVNDPTFADNCDADVTVTYEEVMVSGNCPGGVIRTWIATDNCGNSLSFQQIIFVHDTTAPAVIVTIPAELTVECDQEVPFMAPVFADVCDPEFVVTPSADTTNITVCGYDIVRTWVAMDFCENVTIVTQTIHIVDTTAPVLIGLPENATYECSLIPAAAVVTATDNCDDNVIANYNEVNLSTGCGFVLYRTWSASDDCGNTVSHTQIITAVDQTPPVVIAGVPAELTVECSDSIPEYTPLFADNCDDSLAYTVISGLNNVTPCGYDIEIVWTATDNCGNSTSVSQVIHIVDTTAPVFDNAPADITVECDEIPAPAIVTATDNCHTAVVTFSQTMSEGCPYTITRTWVANDGCGNSATTVQHILVIDTTNPILIGVPGDVLAECDNIPVAAIVTATDNCTDSLTVIPTETVIPGNGCAYLIVRSWTTVDNCGNEVSDSQVITVVDTTAPVLTGEDTEFTIECNIAPTIVAPTATDNCDENVDIVPNTVTIPGDCPNSWTVIHTWTAYDNCLNSAVRTLTIHFQDTTAPVLDGVPANVTVECDSLPTIPVVTADDNCDDEVAVMFEQVYGEGCPYTILQTWTATDDCGNTTIATRTITVIDTTAPVLNGVPADVTVQCGEVPGAADVTATDNCDVQVEVTVNDVVVSEGCPYVVVRTWTATDNCDNMTSATQTFVVNDTIAPFVVEGMPAEITVECSDEVPAFNPVFADNCDDSLDVFAISGIGNVTPCGYDISRSWTAVDNCGNSVSIGQVVHIVDTTAPVFDNVPANVTVECDEIPVPTIVTATDNCHEPIATFDQAISEGCPYTITRTWIANDGCGNVTTAVQIITVIDTTAPYITNNPPVVYNIECGEEMPVNDPAFADNCDEDLTIVYVEDNVSGNCPGGLIRTWTATDNCGNSVSFQQIIFVHDTTAPSVIVSVPAELTVECDQEVPFMTPVFADTCDEEVDVTASADTTNETVCGYDIVRTWVAMDFCENVTIVTQTIHIVDTTAPVLIGTPADATYECSDIPTAPVVTATDNCDEEVAVQYSDITVQQGCGFVVFRTWTASDDCGNAVSYTQTITAIDLTAPVVIAGVPAELTIECSDVVPQFTPLFSDNCDDTLALEAISGINNVSVCGYDIERTWFATDDCGNTISVSQVIHVIDSTNPWLIGVPENTTVECDNIPAPALVFGGDNCDTNVAVSFSQSATEGCPYTITRTWTATDDCGNTGTASQTILVVDTTNPVVTAGVPAELTVECSDDIPAFTPSFADNCDDSLQVVAISGLNNVNNCSYDIERVWTAIDNCGNTVSVSQVVHVVDTTNPILVGVPANVTVECDAVPAAALVTATDNCAEILNVSFTADTLLQDCGYIIIRSWSVYDYCQNVATASQIVTVVDTTEPTFNVFPQDATIECGEDVPAAPAVTASDNCDSEVMVSFDSNETTLDCGYMIERSWTATDDCGNSSTIWQTIYVIDETAPVFTSGVEDMTIQCDQQIPAPAVLTATDNCDAFVTITTNDELLPSECFYQIKRYYHATDDCGNTTTINQMITVVDTTAPVIDGPADITVQCSDIPAPAELGATDNCDADVQVVYTETFGEGCPYTILRTWTATDDCGNTTVVTQIVTVIDEENPVFAVFPEFVVIECDELATYTVTATDNCDEAVLITIAEEFPVSGSCYGSVLRVYQAEDNCGNITTSVTQIIDLVDSTPPTLIGVPADVTIECGQELPPVAAVTADDNCSVDLDVNLVQTQTNEFCPYDVIRTWSTIDDCGNVTVATQVIHVTVTIAQQVQLSVYPNPSAGKFFVKFSMNKEAEVAGGIFDIAGREVMPIMNGTADGGRQYQWEMDAQNLRPGVYNITMKVDGEVYHEKLIVSGR